MDIVYFSNYSGNTKKLVDKLDPNAVRIPIKWDDADPLLVDSDYVLFIPTYGGGNESHTVPRQVVKFLNVESNRKHAVAVVGTGNTNFGSHYCRAAEIVSAKLGVPLLYRVEITGTPEDLIELTNRMENLWNPSTAITS